MQITRDVSTYRLLQYNLSTTSNTINELYVKTAIGTEVSKASDDPSAASSIIAYRSEIAKNERYVENCNHVLDSLSTAETYVDSVEEVMVRAKEIAVYGATDSLTATDRETLAAEVAQLQESLLDLANTQKSGAYIFAGYNDQVAPFSGDPVTYNGTDDHKMIETTSGATVAKNITGEELFMSPVNLFTSLEDLENALLSNDSSLVSNELDTLEEGAEQVRVQRSSMGNTMAQMEDLIAMHSSAQVLLQDNLSSVQDADLTQVLSDVAQMELTLEATMQVTSRISSLSLMDYL